LPELRHGNGQERLAFFNKTDRDAPPVAVLLIDLLLRIRDKDAGRPHWTNVYERSRMLTTFMNAKSFTRAGDTDPDLVKKGRVAALTALGVLIPGEVVSAATAISGFLSEKSDTGDGTASWTHLGLARVLMVVLGIIAIPVLFKYGSGGWWKNRWRGALLLFLTVLSFAMWLALQPLSVYQGWFSIDAGEAAAVGVVAGPIIGGLAALLGWSQASKEP
jgi:hypothetical protein